MKQLKKALEELGLPDDEITLKKFEAYRDKILEWNKMVNITAVTEPSDFTKKHFIDSLLCTKSIEYQQATEIIDIGTGGGFPGVPLAIISPEKQFVLADSLNKRLKIVDTLCQEIGINNVTVVHGRAEELGRSKRYREKFDLCVSRAVARLDVLSEYCLPFVKQNGFFLAYKGPGLDSELEKSKSAISLLGGRVERIEKIEIDDLDFDHNILYIKKEQRTPSKYPRKAGTPSKEPLK